MKNKIIYICVLIISVIIGFFVGKFSSKKDISQLQNDLIIATDKSTNIEKRNEELIKLTETQDIMIKNLERTNETSTSYIQRIKEINSSTIKKLNDLESSTNSTMSSIIKLRENNKILKEYFNSVLSITEEEWYEKVFDIRDAHSFISKNLR